MAADWSQPDADPRGDLRRFLQQAAARPLPVDPAEAEHQAIAWLLQEGGPRGG